MCRVPRSIAPILEFADFDNTGRNTISLDDIADTMACIVDRIADPQERVSASRENQAWG